MSHEQREGWVCPRCRTSVNPDVKTCPRCNSPFGGNPLSPLGISSVVHDEDNTVFDHNAPKTLLLG